MKFIQTFQLLVVTMGIHIPYVSGQTNDQSCDLMELTPIELDAVLTGIFQREAANKTTLQDSSPSAFDILRSGDIEALQAFLDSGGDPNETLGKMPHSLLFSAVLTLKLECAELLIQRGADINAITYGGFTIGTMALLLLNDAKMLQYNAKANMEIISKRNQAVELLVGHGADIDKQTASEKINGIGERVWNHAKEKGATIIQAECYSNSMLLPTGKIALASLEDTVKLKEWLDQYHGNTNQVIAVSVHPGGEQAELRLYEMCLERNIRVFTHRVGKGSPIRGSEKGSDKGAVP